LLFFENRQVETCLDENVFPFLTFYKFLQQLLINVENDNSYCWLFPPFPLLFPLFPFTGFEVSCCTVGQLDFGCTRAGAQYKEQDRN
jgi:hypothetical protein